MSNREELTEASQRLRDSIEDQVDDMKDRVQHYGKIGLWVGGGLLAVLILSKVFGGSEEEDEEQYEEEPKKKKKKKVKSEVRLQAKPNFLSDTLKQQAILFALGLAAKQLKTFLSNLEENREDDGSE